MSSLGLVAKTSFCSTEDTFSPGREVPFIDGAGCIDVQFRRAHK